MDDLRHAKLPATRFSRVRLREPRARPTYNDKPTMKEERQSRAYAAVHAAPPFVTGWNSYLI
jgi:hypothetical protein